MLTPLSDEQRRWADGTLDGMSMEQCVGHLLCPENRGYSTQDWIQLLDKVPLGCVFFGGKTLAEYREVLGAIQKHSEIPVVVAADLEHGAVAIKDECTTFPSMMAAGAADDEDLMYIMGRATAAEGRHAGLHWTFSPVVDLNYNHQNPVTNHRSPGDNPERSARLLPPLIRGMQENGLLAATAKHFPGDGIDDRDQHLCTSVNSLPVDEWRNTYGRVWRAAFEAGVMSVMSGHISFPDYEGLGHKVDEAMPATLSARIQVDLLRKELGFEGVIVSDAAVMIGITSRAPTEEQCVRNIESGSDVYLFANPTKDFERLMAAVRSGRLSEERVRESARRVLEMKARLNVYSDPFGPKPTLDEKEEFMTAARTMAENSVTMIRGDGRPPVEMKPGAKVLTVTIRYENASRKPDDLEAFDEELRARGFTVDHRLNPGHNELIKITGDYDAVFVNFYITMHQRIGTMRMTGDTIMNFWRSFFVDHQNILFTSFGTPYTLYELPHLPNFVATYSACDASQRAAVRVWLGEQEANGRCPVRLPSVQARSFAQMGIEQ